MSLKESFFQSNLIELVSNLSQKAFIRRIIMNSVNVHRYKNGDSLARRKLFAGKIL